MIQRSHGSKILRGPVSCLEPQLHSSQPWQGRVECRELESCGPEYKNKNKMYQQETFDDQKGTDL